MSTASKRMKAPAMICAHKRLITYIAQTFRLLHITIVLYKLFVPFQNKNLIQKKTRYIANCCQILQYQHLHVLIQHGFHKCNQKVSGRCITTIDLHALPSDFQVD